MRYGRFPKGAPATHPVPHVISKIESVEALVNFDAILEVRTSTVWHLTADDVHCILYAVYVLYIYFMMCG